MGKAAPASPFAPETLVRLPPMDGVRFATAEAGIRYQGRTDLMVAVMDKGTSAAGVLTQSKTASAPVVQCRKHLKRGEAQILVVKCVHRQAWFRGR
jgi:glutamate N-acetyltransferase / amino-acid N-acetyltransferase